MDLEDKEVTLTGCQNEDMNKKKIAQLGKVMAIFGAGTLTLICIGFLKSGIIFNLLQ